MNFLKSLYEKFKPSFTRFGAMYFFAVTGFVFSSLNVLLPFFKSGFCEPFIKECGLFCGFSVLFELISERFFEQSNRVKILNIAVPVVLSVPFYFVCKSYNDSHYFNLAVYCLFAAMVLICGLLVYVESKEKTGANILSGFVLSNIISICVGVALTIIILAIDNLIFDFEYDEKWIVCSWIFAYWPLFLGFFVSCATLKYEQIEITKAFKVVFMYALFPLYWVLIGILYVYLLKAVVTLSLPNGQINWFVSFAFAFYVLFNVSFRCYSNKILDVFYKWGGVVLSPLVVIQIVAFVIRIQSYGITSTRYASLIYIVFSVAVLIVSIAEGFSKDKNCSVDFLRSGFVLGAIGFVWACLPGVNLYDVSNRSMINVIESTYRKHDLFDEEKGLLVTADADKVFNAEEKNAIKSAWYEIEERIERHEIKWATFTVKKDSDEKFSEEFSFKSTFGFDYSWRYEDTKNKHKFTYKTSKEKIDIKGYSSLVKVVDLIRDKDGRNYITLESDDYRWDVTEECKKLLEEDMKSKFFENPYIIDRGNKRLILTYINYDYDEDNDGTDRFYGSASGYELTK